MHCPDSQQISYITLRNQVTCLLKIAQVSRITVVTKETGLFTLENELLFYRKGYDRSEKGTAHGKRGMALQEKGMAQGHSERA